MDNVEEYMAIAYQRTDGIQQDFESKWGWIFHMSCPSQVRDPFWRKTTTTKCFFEFRNNIPL